MLASPVLPPPVNDKRCRNCSLKELCQPAIVDDQVRYARHLAELFGGEP
jgi:CRISPR-associated exonuclease Cas4